MGSETTFAPLVSGDTKSQSLNVRSMMDSFDHQKYYVPDYQRDSSQWDIPKKSLFIESLINNLTISPLRPLRIRQTVVPAAGKGRGLIRTRHRDL